MFSNSAKKLAMPLVACLQICAAQAAGQRTFQSVDEASEALFAAVEADQTSAIAQLLGPRNELISSSDPTQDKRERAQFVSKYRQMHRLVRGRNGEVILYIGAENWPFPIPLVSHGGRWRYDSDAGAQEVVDRQIGENEVTAIEACERLVASLKEPQAHIDADDPVGMALAAVRANGKPVAFQGYYFRTLSNSGASGILAYPIEYGSSGIMTFVVNDARVVYEKDLGADTKRVATALGAYPADSTWKAAATGFADSR